MNGYPERLYHKTPGWVRERELFHIRIRAEASQTPPLVDPALSRELLMAAQRYHEMGHWWCELFLLMPDHLHALIRFPGEPGMAAVISNWKRGTARFQRVKCQENFFDHRIRSPGEAAEKWRYIRMNPVAKGLCLREDEWPHWWSGTQGGTR